MPALEPFCQLLGIDFKKFSKNENILIEIDIFFRLQDKLKIYFNETSETFFKFINYGTEIQNMMREDNLIKAIISDILSTGDYTIIGISNYTNIHLDIVSDLACGLNTKPLTIYSRKIIELHRKVRPELYYSLAKKIISEYELGSTN
jgi:hypothetical protein